MTFIVVKLMAKNAEERYQSALGFKSDLEKCLIQLVAGYSGVEKTAVVNEDRKPITSNNTFAIFP